MLLYFKDNAEKPDVRELHGNIRIVTTDSAALDASKPLTLGWVYGTKGQKTGKLDGILTSTTFTANTVSPSVRDIHYDLDAHDELENALEKHAQDSLSDWMVNSEISKSYIKCDGPTKLTNCTVNIHFMRKFSTDDPENDIQLVKGDLNKYSLTAFYQNGGNTGEGSVYAYLSAAPKLVVTAITLATSIALLSF